MEGQRLVVCLTGGIASGKTAVSDIWASQSVDVIDTDVISREVVEPGSHGLNELVSFFGKRILECDGTLNRKALRTLVFNDDGKRLALNKIVHPLIKNVVIRSLREARGRLAVVVIPLYTPSIDYPFIDRVCLVDCQEETQLNRLQHRDAISLELAQKMIAAQSPRFDRIAWSDDVIVNEGDFTALRIRAHALLSFYQDGVCAP